MGLEVLLAGLSLALGLLLGLSSHWATGPGSRASTAFCLREGSGQTVVAEPSLTYQMEPLLA